MSIKKDKLKKYFKDFLWITFATTLTAIGIYFFKFPNNFSTGGVTGVAVILAKLIPTFTAANYSTVINLPLILSRNIFPIFVFNMLTSNLRKAIHQLDHQMKTRLTLQNRETLRESY